MIQERIVKAGSMVKKGLVLEGGAMRGLFTCGVLDVLMEHNVEFDGAVGVSAGAAFGCNYKSRQPGRVIRYNKKLAHDPRFSGIRCFLKTGDFYGAEFDYHTLPNEIDIMDSETYRANPMEFYYVCTDLNTGKAVYHKSEELTYDDLEWMRASASMPLVSRVVKIDGYELLDGGISDSIPLKFFQSRGYGKNVVILTQPEGYVKKKNKWLPLLRIALRRYPRAVRALATRHIRYNRQTAYVRAEEKRGNCLVIAPEKPLGIGSTEHDPEVMQRVYETGRREGEKRLSKILSYLNND